MSSIPTPNNKRSGDPREELRPSQATFAEVAGQMLALTWHRQHSTRADGKGDSQPRNACHSAAER